MDNLRGAFLMVLAMLGFAVEDMFIKLMAGAVPVGQILLMLGLGGSIIFGAILIRQGVALLSRAMMHPAVLIRLSGEMIGALGFISAIIYMPLSTASAILQATPLVVTLGAALFLGEAVGWRRWSAIFVGFFGVLLIIRPGLEGFSPLSLYALVGVAGLAARDIAIRRVPASITSMQLSFLGFAAIIPAGLILLALTGTSVTGMSPTVTAYVICALTIGVFAYFAIVVATRIGEVSFVTPFRYTRMVFALILGVLVFDEAPDMLTLLGAAIVIASGIYTLWRERKNHAKTSPHLSKTR